VKGRSLVDERNIRINVERCHHKGKNSMVKGGDANTKKKRGTRMEIIPYTYKKKEERTVIKN